MKKNYGGVVWTDHALERMRERGIKQGDAWATFSNPHSSKKASTEGAYVYYKTFGDTRIEVVAKKSYSKILGDNDKWIILSVWSKAVRGNSHSNNLLSFLKKVFGY